jgi:type VII secretion-associated serine protease mycosin
MLAGKVLEGTDLVGSTDGRDDAHGHGTLVASVIAGTDTDDGVPVYGVAPDATILPARIQLDENGVQGEAAQALSGRLAAAIDWAVENNANVINMSVSSPDTPELANAVARAADSNVVLVAAAGNLNPDTGQEPYPHPAAYPEVISVANVNSDGAQAALSRAGEDVDVSAPGVEIIGAQIGTACYVQDSGTSYAAPYVSGVAALIRAYHPDMPASEVAQRIIDTADRPPDGRNEFVGSGVVNPYRAVTTELGERPNQPAVEVAPPPVEPDPLASTRRIALWATLGGLVLTALLLLIPRAIRRGHQRRWRPARLSS